MDADHIATIAGLNARVKNLEGADADQWKKIDAIRDRLPNWAVVVMSIGGAIIGYLLNWALSCLK